MEDIEGRLLLKAPLHFGVNSSPDAEVLAE